MKRLLFYYAFILVTLLTIAGFTSASSFGMLLPALLSFPLMVYFGVAIAPKRTRAILLPKQQVIPKTKKVKIEKAEVTKIKGFDIDRRAFLKIIGSAGLALFFFTLFTKKTEAAFFGSVPGPGTVALKDSTGTVIDPAKHHPTDGYKINQLDDASPAFYGFTNKDGAWFIMKEDSSGNYRYTKGASDFTNATTGWPNRANLTYNYFDNVF